MKSYWRALLLICCLPGILPAQSRTGRPGADFFVAPSIMFKKEFSVQAQNPISKKDLKKLKADVLSASALLPRDDSLTHHYSFSETAA